ncbi:tetraacyldisaccharide 4'-kinase [Asticcacaulis solisilvae]|uniref:tetraacyldisaccharide 4'-kinase n=1 Tax=Asticcacaulis solisilvae TaxID=1217274 RepID=UPI003FD6E5C4
MSIRTPRWWYRKDAEGAPWWRPVLKPLAAIWLAVNEDKRRKARPYRSSLFVISVGNLTLGGSGKTPIAAELLRLLSVHKVAGLSRGYGGAQDHPTLVDPDRHTAREVGDEPLMLARHGPMMVALDRAEGLKALERDGFAIAVVDDAHQNLKIAKDLHILVVDADTRDGAWPFGDGGICPDGPLREPLSEGIARADIVVLWMPDALSQPDSSLSALFAEKPVFVARLTPERLPEKGAVIGLAGIAKPWKFEATLRDQGFDVRAFEAFADHAEIPEGRLHALALQAERQGARLITTEKDWVRLSPHWRLHVAPLPIAARFDDESGFLEALTKALPPGA